MAENNKDGGLLGIAKRARGKSSVDRYEAKQSPQPKAKVKAKAKPKQMKGTGGLSPAQVKARNKRISATLASAQAKQKRLREAEYSK